MKFYKKDKRAYCLFSFEIVQEMQLNGSQTYGVWLCSAVEIQQKKYGMSSSFSKFQYLRRLQSLKAANFKAQQHDQTSMLSMQQSKSELYDKYLGQEEHQMMHLQQVVKKVKINSIVNQFIYKLTRNLVLNEPKHLQMIVTTLTQIKTHHRYHKTLKINDKIVAIFMILNVFAILFIQTLSAFQGFYLGYQEEDSKRPGIIIIELVCVAIFLIKIVFSCFSSYSVNGVRQKYIRYVAKAYLCSWVFVFDFMNLITSLFKLIFSNSSAAGIVCFVVTALSILVLSRGFQVVQIVFFNNFRQRQYFAIFKILVFNIFFAQFVSSIFMAISYWDLQENWIQKAINNGNMAADLTWWQIYFYSMYWAITTLTTIGYGDITPSNYFEVAFVGLIMLFGTAVLSYNLSEIGSVISNLRSIDQRRKQEVLIFKRMSKDEQISEDLQSRIIDYINKSAEVRAQFQFQERKQFLNQLPQQLKEEYQSQYATNIFEKVSFFNLLEPGTLSSLSMKLNGQIFYPGQQITKKDASLPSIMFLKHGKIGYACLKPGSILNGLILERRQINRDRDSPYLLNKYLLTSDRQINHQIIAENYCFVLTLEYDDFYDVLRQSRKDNEFYFSLYFRMSYIDQEWDQFQCQFCAPRKHTVFMCSKLHYMPYKSLIVQRQTLSPNIEQQRRPIYNRKVYRAKLKSALSYWKEFLQFVEIEFSAGYTKKGEKSRQQQEKMSAEDPSDKKVYKITEQVLKLHCCEINARYIEQKEFEIDKMYNYEHFFPECNPQNLNMINIKLTRKRLYKVPIKY